jgi:uncharacterized protein (AIM24 family)
METRCTPAVVNPWLTINGGVLKGTGIVKAALVTNKGTIDQTGLSSLQTLVIDGAYTQTNTGSVKLRLRRVNGVLTSDTLGITGAATLAGTLEVVAEPGFAVAAGDDINVVTFASRTGTFGTTTVPTGMEAEAKATAYGVKKKP